MRSVRMALLVGAFLIISCNIIGCKGGKVPMLGDILGPTLVDEYSHVEYSIVLNYGTGVSFLWSCNPSSAGEFDSPTLPKTGFTAGEVDSDITVEIRVLVSTNQSSPILKSIEVTIKDTGPFGWALTWGGIDDDYAQDVTMDSVGNIYVTGIFIDAIDFDPGPGVVELTSNGDHDIFLCKLNSSGEFQWALSIGGSDFDESWAVVIDADGYVYIAGEFGGTVDFDPDGGIDERTSYGSRDIFLCKFNTDGDFQWVRTCGGDGRESFGGVTTENDGIYITGTFLETVDFDPGPDIEEYSSNGGADAFISKYDPNGDFQWVRTWGGVDHDHGRCAATGNGGIYVGGAFAGTVDFNPGPGIDDKKSNGGRDVFLSKLNSDGEFVWSRTWGGGQQDSAVGAAVDGEGNIYVTGTFMLNVDFDPGPEIDEHVSNGDSDIFLCKLDVNGDFQWAHTWGSSLWDHSFGIESGYFGNIYITGMFKETLDFDPGPETDVHSSNGNNDIFLCKYNSKGVYQWGRTWGGNSTDVGTGVASDSAGNVYVTGYFQWMADFEPGPGIENHISNGETDIFLCKFSPDGTW